MTIVNGDESMISSISGIVPDERIWNENPSEFIKSKKEAFETASGELPITADNLKNAFRTSELEGPFWYDKVTKGLDTDTLSVETSTFLRKKGFENCNPSEYPKVLNENKEVVSNFLKILNAEIAIDISKKNGDVEAVKGPKIVRDYIIKTYGQQILSHIGVNEGQNLGVMETLDTLGSLQTLFEGMSVSDANIGGLMEYFGNTMADPKKLEFITDTELLRFKNILKDYVANYIDIVGACLVVMHEDNLDGKPLISDEDYDRIVSDIRSKMSKIFPKIAEERGIV